MGKSTLKAQRVLFFCFVLVLPAISLVLLTLVWLILVTDISISFGQFGPSTITYMTLNTLNYFLTIMGESKLI